MASATVTLSNRLKTALAQKKVDFSADAFKACLVRSGFVFNPDLHKIRSNFKGSISAAISFIGSTAYLAAGGFSIAGFISGNVVSISGGNSVNNASLTLTSATDTYLYFLESYASLLTSTVRIEIADELVSANGYSQDAMLMSGIFLGEDLANDWLSITWSTNLSWLAVGGSIGPVSGMLIIDDTASVIIGYLSFASADTVAIANSLLVNGVVIRLA